MSWGRRDQVAYEDTLGPSSRLVTSDWRVNGVLWRNGRRAGRVCISPPVRTIVAGRNASAAPRRSLDTISYEWPLFRSTDGMFEGWLMLELARSGGYAFAGLFHNCAGAAQDYSAVCAIPTRNGRLLVFSSSGTVRGVTEADQEGWRRWDLYGSSVEVQRHWHAIAPNAQPRGTVANCRDVGSMITEVQAAEKAATGAVQIVSWIT